MTQKIHHISETDLPSGQISFFNITWKDQELKDALSNWLIFLKEVADIDTRISFDVTISIALEHNLLSLWGTFNGPQKELHSIFNPWLTKNPQPISFIVLNSTQMDINREVGISIPFPMTDRQHVVSAMAVNITNAMLDIILEPQLNSSERITRVMHLVYLTHSNKDNHTAWPFSDVSFVIGPVFSWLNPEIDSFAIDIAESWLERLFIAAAPTDSIIGSYLNYIDPYLQDWQSMYYRDHWERLREIKSTWDPTGYFSFPQGIPPNAKQSYANRLSYKLFTLFFTLMIKLLL